MSNKLTNASIIRFLKEKYQATGFVDGLKIRYRSLICPFTSLIEMVKPGEKAGDVGCGSGQFLLLLSEFSEPSYLYGIEITPRLIENANVLFASRPPGTFGFEVYDGVHFPRQLGEMDILFLVDVLHHVPVAQQHDFLKNLVSCMKPGARLVLKDINAASPLVVFNKIHDAVFAGEIGHELKMENARQILQANGLTIIKEHKRRMYVYPHYTLVGQK